MRHLARSLVLASAFVFFCSHAWAVLRIDINQGNIDPLPIALPDFGTEGDRQAARIGRDIIRVIESDLEGSGLFESINRRAFIQRINGTDTLPSFNDWRQINASALFTGDLKLVGNGEFEAKFRLWDVFAEQQIAGKSFTTDTANWRRIAHLMADEIYSRLTGEKGYFDTRIVYVSESGSALKRKKRLAIMDQDGANHRYLTSGDDLVLTPRFSPTAQEIIYLSYASGTAKVYMLNVDSGKRRLIGDFQGMSFAPRFSPDGKSVVMSVAVDGNSEIYIMDLANKRKRRLTFDGAIDTSPSFSPDGRKIVFNSDRGGSQQLYVMDVNGKNVKRISFSGKGRYGTPVWSPRGDLIAFTKMMSGKFHIGVMYPDGTGERLLTESYLDEGPTWAPNGRVLMFARQSKHQRHKAGAWSIHSIDLTGYNEKEVTTPKGASDPAWSPLL